MPFRTSLLAAAAITGILFCVEPVSAQETCYVDRKQKVCFPLGARSFADQVTSFFEGNPTTKFAGSRIVSTVLGEPDNDESNENEPEKPQKYLTLGCGGTLTLQFRDNALIDVPGADLYVFEIGGHVEATFLAISTDGKQWTDVGKVKGGLATVDIASVAKPGARYQFVRLQDARERCDSRWPGAEIDAVGAIGSVAVTNGQLRVTASDSVTLAPKRIGLILDASGSMRGKLPSGKTKIVAAKGAMRTIVAGLPEGPDVGLRIYGHRLPSRPKNKSCGDSELVVPFGALDRKKLTDAISAVKPKGQTPIGRSLALMADDLGKADGFNMIVVVSDGIETCSPKPGDADYPPDIVEAMKKRGVRFRVNVVGFDIESSETREFLTGIAELSGGSYIGANNANELEKAVRGAIELAFAVEDAAGKRVLESTVGAAPVDLPPGTYTVVVEADPQIRIGGIQIKSGEETKVTAK